MKTSANIRKGYWHFICLANDTMVGRALLFPGLIGPSSLAVRANYLVSAACQHIHVDVVLQDQVCSSVNVLCCMEVCMYPCNVHNCIFVCIYAY